MPILSAPKLILLFTFVVYCKYIAVKLLFKDIFGRLHSYIQIKRMKFMNEIIILVIFGCPFPLFSVWLCTCCIYIFILPLSNWNCTIASLIHILWYIHTIEWYLYSMRLNQCLSLTFSFTITYSNNKIIVLPAMKTLTFYFDIFKHLVMRNQR